VDEWVNDRNNVHVCSFLAALCGKKYSDMSTSEKTKIVFAIEHLYSLVPNNIILPFSFSLNLLTYYVSNNKAVCNLIASTHPLGGYSSVLNWIEMHSKNPLNIPSDHDIIAFFDNN
jgi:hypothetical protein